MCGTACSAPLQNKVGWRPLQIPFWDLILRRVLLRRMNLIISKDLALEESAATVGFPTSFFHPRSG
jgi:hypothetical protein